jgi:hypothetical protein
MNEAKRSLGKGVLRYPKLDEVTKSKREALFKLPKYDIVICLPIPTPRKILSYIQSLFSAI